MKSASSKEIIEALANGIDYETGEILPVDSILNRAEVVRALYLCLDGLKLIESKKSNKSNFQINSGKAWTDIEDTELTYKFKSGMSIKEISNKHGRTSGAITSRLKRLGLIK